MPTSPTDPPDTSDRPHPRSAARATALPRTVVALGLVSLLMDTSSELIHSLLPLFVVSGLGASAALFGLLEGFAEASVLVTKMVSGAMSDFMRRRKPLALLGYGLAAVSRPLFPLASSVATVFAARLVDRIGKGIRGAPRDALIADVTPSELRGAAYGLRQSLDSIGALLGPLLAVGLMALFSGHIPSVYWCAVVPAALAVVVLVTSVREPRPHEAPPRDAPPRERAAPHARWPIQRAAIGHLGAPFARVVGVGVALTLARFSEGFLVLRALDVGAPPALTPLVMVAMNLSYALSSYPVGRLSDRMDRAGLLTVGTLLLAGSQLCLWVGGIPMVALGAVLWGLHMGSSQGLLAAMVADAAPDDARGTAFGLFNLASGVSMLLASVIAGLLWDHAGAGSTFLCGAVLALLATAGLRLVR